MGESAGDSQDLYNVTSRFAEGDKIISVSALGSFNLALSEKGRVYAWGNNQYGQKLVMVMTKMSGNHWI